MRTDDLTAALRAATDEQPFVPDPTRAWDRSRSLRARRRAAAAGASFAVCVLAAGGVLVVPGLVDRPDVVTGRFAQGAPGSPVTFTVQRNLDQTHDVPCVFDIVLKTPASPSRITMPCDTGFYDDMDTLAPPAGRQDRVRSNGDTRLVTSGTVPAGTVAVTAVDDDGQPLTAELQSPAFTGEIVFVITSDGDRVNGLRYRLADGRQSPANNVFTP